jgi:hypothetical protein
LTNFFCGLFLPKMMQNNAFHTSKFQNFQKLTRPTVLIEKKIL